MSGEIKDILQEYKAAILQLNNEHIKKMILFGSYARGDFSDDSDIDIMILTDLENENITAIEKQICDATYDFNYEMQTDIMPIIQNEEHFNFWKNSYMFYKNVATEGIVV